MRVVVLEGQAAVVITHWDDEVPWAGENLGGGDGVVG